jgi:hypothetical protein
MKRLDSDFPYVGNRDCDAASAVLSAINRDDFEAYSVRPYDRRCAAVEIYVRSAKVNDVCLIGFTVPFELIRAEAPDDLRRLLTEVAVNGLAKAERRKERTASTPPTSAPPSLAPSRADR